MCLCGRIATPPPTRLPNKRPDTADARQLDVSSSARPARDLLVLYHHVDDMGGPRLVRPEAQEKRGDGDNGHGKHLVLERVQVHADDLELGFFGEAQHGDQAAVNLIQLLLRQAGSGSRTQRDAKLFVKDDGADGETKSSAKDPGLRHGPLRGGKVVVLGLDRRYHGAGGKGESDPESVDGGKPQEENKSKASRESKHQGQAENLDYAAGNERLAGEVGLLRECTAQEGAKRAGSEHGEKVDARPERAVAVDNL